MLTPLGRNLKCWFRGRPLQKRTQGFSSCGREWLWETFSKWLEVTFCSGQHVLLTGQGPRTQPTKLVVYLWFMLDFQMKWSGSFTWLPFCQTSSTKVKTKPGRTTWNMQWFLFHTAVNFIWPLSNCRGQKWSLFLFALPVISVDQFMAFSFLLTTSRAWCRNKE